MVKRFKNNTSKYLVLTVLMLLMASIMVACGSDGSNSEVVGKVNDINITKEDLYNAMVEQMGDQTLESLISEKIVELEAKKEDIKVTDKEIEEELDVLKEQYGGDEALEQVLLSQGLTADVLKDNIKMNIMIKKLIGTDIEVKEEEIKEFYEENKEQFGEKEEVDANHILVETKEEAEEIKAKLDDGEDFEELAKKHSTDGSKDEGGALGFFGKGEMVPEFEEVAFSMKKGEISDIVKSEFGYHIIRVNEKKEGKEASLEDSEEEIKDAIIESKLPEEYQKWYQERYEEYEVENKLNK